MEGGESKMGATRGTETGGTAGEGMEVEVCGREIGIMKGVRGGPEVTCGREEDDEEEEEEEEEEGDELG